jgi:hypothetical protein
MSLANALHAGLSGGAARVRILGIDTAVGLPALTAAADRPGTARSVAGAVGCHRQAGTADAHLVKAAVRRAAAGRRGAHATPAMTRAATRVVNAGHARSPAFTSAAQPSASLSADATAAIRARRAGCIRVRAGRAVAMEARSAAAIGIRLAGVALAATLLADGAIAAFAAAAIGVIGTRCLTRSTGSADPVDAPRRTAAGCAVRALCAHPPARDAGPIEAIAGAAFGVSGAGVSIVLAGDANALNAESGAAGVPRIARGTR